ncbi:hypothetical protein [Micromonospora sp. WMMD1082]|uniref:hypothetical protein n=1 Tax=Micromonospora sp. WMMD1082 TaxID=3016104 RepID=UPI0024161E23|nr:hypothetical protein [Micromonospora sp. WMMD1082]MDG4795512.1 hypothetical protein [Micromonospora sp. WMMD1082]
MTGIAAPPAPATRLPDTRADVVLRCGNRGIDEAVAQAHAEHAAGACDDALRALATVHTDATRAYGHGSRESMIILAHLGYLYALCGWHDLARRCHGTALTAATRYLPPADTLRAQLAALACPPGDTIHVGVCRHQSHAAPRRSGTETPCPIR